MSIEAPLSLGETPLVRSSCAHVLLEQLQESGEWSVEALAARLGCAPEVLQRSRDLLTWNQFAELTRLVGDQIGLDAMETLGDAVETDQESRRMASVITAVADARGLYRMASRWVWPTFWPMIECALEVTGPCSLTVRLTIPEGCDPCPAWFATMRGVLKKLPGMLGLPSSEVARLEGDEVRWALYRVQHAASTTLWSRVKRALRALLFPGALIEEMRSHTEEMNARLTELSAANARARAQQQLKDHLLTNISHEMRTPLTAAIGLNDMMAETGLDARQQALLSDIQQANHRLLGLITDLLDLSTLEHGALELSSQTFSLRELLDVVCAEHAVAAAARGLTLRLSAPPDDAPRLCGDVRRIRQILDQLVDNAIKFTPSGEVIIGATLEDGTDASTTALTMWVEDTGPGIPEALRGALFETFLQGDGSLTRAAEGLGMGLMLCHRLAHAMDGTLLIGRAPGGGARLTLSVVLPRASSELTITPASTVLVVDDNPINRRVLCHILRKLGFETEEAADGAEAVERLRAAPRPSAVLMDCQMPVMDGLEATRQIRASGQHDALPIIAVTAHAQEGYERHCMDAGMDAYLAKPVRAGQLAALLCAPAQREAG